MTRSWEGHLRTRNIMERSHRKQTKERSGSGAGMHWLCLRSVLTGRGGSRFRATCCARAHTLSVPKTQVLCEELVMLARKQEKRILKGERCVLVQG